MLTWFKKLDVSVKAALASWGGAAGLVAEAIAQPTKLHTAVFGGGGVLLAIAGTLGKLSHDKAVRVAALWVAKEAK